MRVGLGFDAHPFAEGRRLRLGGLDWDFPRGLSGHSDGDVVLHAVADALLGAAGLGSLGERFPDRDPANRQRDSRDFVTEVWEELAPRFRLANLDVLVLGEEPRISPRRAEVQRGIAQLLGAGEDRVCVRGTSTNGLGFLGRGEGLAALATVLLEEKAP
jgi:2-C-methyl-D-erythritol 2,4-cyclodiphosphate synthase